MGNDFVIRPAITHDGKFFELKALQQEIKIRRAHKKKISSIIATREEKIDFDQYTLRNFQYKVPTEFGQRLVEVEVFIDDKFKGDITNVGERTGQIRKYVMFAAPWIFSYGWRYPEYDTNNRPTGNGPR
jgi:hypothetical protein